MGKVSKCGDLTKLTKTGGLPSGGWLNLLIMTLSITQHAFDRAKERLSWSKDVTIKMSEKAYTQGITHKETKGNLNKYITKEFFKYMTANNIRIYGENIFFFKNDTLLTIYQLPVSLRKYISK